MALPVHRLSEFYPYAKLKPEEINFDRDTWLKDPMSRLHTDTVQRTGNHHFHKTTRALVASADIDARPWEQWTIDSSCILAWIWEETGSRREMRTARASGRGAADSDKRCNCQASVQADGRPTGRQTMLHLPGSRRRASGQATNVRQPHGRTSFIIIQTAVRQCSRLNSQTVIGR